MGQSWEQTRIKEEKFFKSHEVWHKVDKLRCGTQNLASAASILLTQMIEETLVSSRMQLNNTSLPTLKKSITESLRGLQEQLDALPRAFDANPQAHLLSLCNAFLQDIDNYTSGKQQYDPGQRAFLQDAAIHYRSLQTEVRKTKPEFLIPPSQSRASCILVAPPIVMVPSISPAPSSPNQDSPPPKSKDSIQG
jgi:Dynamin central region